jgi:hypothetical protein
VKTELLASWNDTPSRNAIVQFVEDVTRADSPHFVALEQRIAVFDNDGTLWCEKPMPVELGFILQRMSTMADEDPTLRAHQPWKAARDKDYAWLGNAITKHYHGDDSDVRVLMAGILKAFAGMSVESYAASADMFLHRAQHPTLKRGLSACGYQPMVELLRYLEANGFTNYIASAGDRDFMRVITDEIYKVPPERVIGSTTALRYEDGTGGGSVVYQAQADAFDDGRAKPVRIWSRIGRRPIVAVGNSNGDLEMLRFAGGTKPALRVLLLHDDGDREFEYTAGAERVLELARASDWPVISIRNDWNTVFAA